jgi:5-methylcytosine-specific restriction endonuclease McrBC regulatory subunit McrC
MRVDAKVAEFHSDAPPNRFLQKTTAVIDRRYKLATGSPTNPPMVAIIP